VGDHAVLAARIPHEGAQRLGDLVRLLIDSSVIIGVEGSVLVIFRSPRPLERCVIDFLTEMSLIRNSSIDSARFLSAPVLTSRARS
jgi:hypothetical protein